jgi:hypothetical protein
LDDGIYSEKPNNKDTSTHKYTNDNISYKLDKKFIYNYYYLDKKGNKYKFLLKENGTEDNPLNLVSSNDKKTDVIEKIKYVVDDGDEMLKEIKDYTQTTFGIFYMNRSGKSRDSICELMKKQNPKIPCCDEGTGIVDNKMNLWIHPPRSFTFKILQFCPFPFQYLDETVNAWVWNLETGGEHYFDKRWIEVKGQETIKIRYAYQREKEETIDTPLGKILCEVTKGTGTCETFPMRTSLKSYYHPTYGFVRLEYDLINGDKMVIWLEEMK